MRREHSGNAKATTLDGGISSGATTIVVADGTGWPTGGVGPFVVTIDAGLAGEEKVLVTSRSGNTLSGASRGYDGTTASAHDNGAAITHTFSAVEADEANAHVNQTGADDPHPGYVLDAELTAGLAGKAAAAHTHSKTVRIPHTWTISTPAVPSGATNYIPPFFVSLPAGQTASIAAARHRIRGGTSATWTISHGTVDSGTSVTGLAAVASSTTPTTTAASGANTLSDGDAVQLVLSAVSGSPDALTVTVFLDVTV